MIGGEAFQVPKWFVAFLSVLGTLLGFAVTGAVPWAWTLSNDMAAVRTKLEGLAVQQAREIEFLSTRSARNEMRIDRGDAELQTIKADIRVLESKVGGL